MKEAGSGKPEPGPIVSTVANGHRGHPAGSACQRATRPRADRWVRGCGGLCITSFGAPTSTRINYFLATGGGPGADTMRSATLAAMGWSLLLTGCANGWFPSPNLPTALFTGSAPSPASSVPSRAADCSAKMSSPFGAGVDTSSLSAVLDDSARAAQSCGWEKGTRVSYGSPPATTAALAERK
jgi:hypothetical protein